MHTTEQLNTALAGRYVIDRKIGEGGMAAVYLARDIKHHRQVALKVLNPELGVVLGSERFMAEIEVTANLHHPHLLPLFDSGEAGGLLFYVMPFVEGETLRARLQRERQLNVDDAIRIAAAVASALDYAHRHNVIHRDLKPENILMHEGQPLVMDFGIALAVSRAGGARITQTGLSLGTPQYMSPEQATGDHTLDGRTDIYSLGAVLYEMLVGDPPHTGSTVQSVIAKVITEQPSSVRATRPNVPEHVEAALFKALAKLPADRFTTAADFAAAIEGTRPVAMSTTGARMPAPATTRSRMQIREVAAWTLAAAGVVAAVAFGLRDTERPGPPPARLSVAVPTDVSLERRTGLSLSADGSMLAFAAREGRGTPIYVRRMADGDLRRVAGTDGAGTFALSPDGQSLAFVQDRTLNRVPVHGGAPQPIADSAGAPVWIDGGRLLFSFQLTSLVIVGANGGAPTLLARPDTALGHQRYLSASVLPGGRAALINIVVRGSPAWRLGVVTIPDGKVTDLGVTGIAPRYSEPGYIVYHRGDGVLLATPFSARSRKITGEPVRIAEGVVVGASDIADFAVSHNGVLAYRWRAGVAQQPTTLHIVDRAGRARAVRTADARMFTQPRVSPDGRRVALRVGGDRFNAGDLWMLELSSGALTRITSDDESYRASWSRDGRRLIYMNGRGESTRIVSRPWDGSGSDSVLLAAPSMAEFSEGRPGAWSAIRVLGGRDIYMVPTDSVGTAPRVPFVRTPANETDITISPDGNLIAYQSDETGRNEVYVRPIPGPGARVMVSVGGGIYPRWSRDGSTLFYRGEGWMRSVAITTRPELSLGRRDSLFADVYISDAAEGLNYSLMPNGDFFMVGGSDQPNHPRIDVVTNWPSLLTRRAAGER